MFLYLYSVNVLLVVQAADVRINDRLLIIRAGTLVHAYNPICVPVSFPLSALMIEEPYVGTIEFSFRLDQSSRSVR